MSMYVFAPAGSDAFRNGLMKLAIEFIGSQESGFGSPWAKGKRYIKREVPSCSGRALKRACVVVDKYFNHDFNEYGTEVYYCHKECYDKIIATVLRYIVSNQDKDALPQTFSNLSFNELLEKTNGHRISQLKWVENTDYKGQGEAAEKISQKLNRLH